MSDDLTPTDYAYLTLLRIEDREIDNNELAERHGVRLKGPALAKLNGGGYVDSDTKRGRAYRHRISKKGIRALEGPLVVEEVEGAKKRPEKEQLLWAALAARHGSGLKLPATTPPPPISDTGSLEERLRLAYARVGDGPGSWVSLTELRPLFTDVSKAELDKALEKMLDAPDVRLDPEVHRHRIDDRVRAAAVRIGGEDRHKMAIGLR